MLLLILLLALLDGTEARAGDWEWNQGLVLVSPGGDLQGIPSGLGITGVVGKALGPVLDISARMAASRHRMAGVDILYLMVSSGLGGTLSLGKGLNLTASGGWTIHRVDYDQVPILQEGDGPFFGVGLAWGRHGQDLALDFGAHQFDVKDNRGVSSDGWTTTFGLRFAIR